MVVVTVNSRGATALGPVSPPPSVLVVTCALSTKVRQNDHIGSMHHPDLAGALIWRQVTVTARLAPKFDLEPTPPFLFIVERHYAGDAPAAAVVGAGEEPG